MGRTYHNLSKHVTSIYNYMSDWLSIEMSRAPRFFLYWYWYRSTYLIKPVKLNILLLILIHKNIIMYKMTTFLRWAGRLTPANDTSEELHEWKLAVCSSDDNAIIWYCQTDLMMEPVDMNWNFMVKRVFLVFLNF